VKPSYAFYIIFVRIATFVKPIFLENKVQNFFCRNEVQVIFKNKLKLSYIFWIKIVWRLQMLAKSFLIKYLSQTESNKFKPNSSLKVGD
jgi:hypothetical protein